MECRLVSARKFSPAAQALHDAVEARLGPVSNATIPLYCDHDGRPVPNGSGVLFRAGDFRFVLTAAHVADAASLCPLITGTAQTLLRLEGSWTAIKPPRGQGRLADQLDIAVLTLKRGSSAAIPDSSFIEVSELDTTARELDDEIFLVAGYPGTKRRAPRNSPALEVEFYPALAVSRPRRDYEALHLNPDHHMLLGFSKKRMWRRGVRLIAPDLHEMSGCGVWAIGPEDSQYFQRLRLTGLLIGQRRARAVPLLQATRMSVVIDGVGAALKALRASLAAEG